jgi:AraC family transcriptional regulator
MNLSPEIRTTERRILAGKSVTMSLIDNRTGELWRTFMPLRKSILSPVNPVLYSVNVYGKDYFAEFNPSKEFIKWAGIEISDAKDTPGELEPFELPAGMYAVFLYKGLPADGARFFQAIYTQWLPRSEYQLDHRPHFEVLDNRYKNDSPDSEEEIWIPVKLK